MTNKLFKNLISQCYIVVFMLIGATNLLAQTTRNVSNYSELTSAISAAANGDIINFTTNIVIDNEITISGKTLTFQGNDYEISVPNPGLDDMGRYNSLASAFRVFFITSSSEVTFNNLSLKGGAITGQGGAVYVDNGSTLRVNNSIISSSRAASGGGVGIAGNVFFKNSYVRRNAANYGGGILVRGTGRAYVEESTMVENRSTQSNGGGGAAECQSGGLLFFNNSTLSNNQSTEIGGAVNNYRGTVYFINSSATGNVAFGSQKGGAIGNNGGNVYILNSLFAHNYRRTTGSVTNPTGYVLDDFEPYSSPGGIRLYHSIYHATLPTGLGVNTANIQYTGASNGSNNSIFSGGLLSRITDTNGTEIGEQIYRPFLYNNQGSVAPTLQVGSFVSQTANRGVPTRFSDNNNNSPAIAYFSGGSWINLLGTSASGQEVVQDQVGSSRNGSTPSRGAIESELDQVLYIVKVNGASGGTVNGGTIYGDVYQAGSSVTLTAIPNSGQQFVRWDYVAGGSGTASTANPYTFTVNQDVTLIPVFSTLAAGSYTVTYVGNGNTSGTVPAVGTFSGSTTIASAGTLAKEGYGFAGWNTNSNGSGTSYAAGATYSAGTNLTLYAIWLNTISTPSVSSNQSFCEGARVSDLVATGTNLKWYDVAEGGYPFGVNHRLSSGTYYVSQSVANLESDRVPVEVTLLPRLTTISAISGTTTLASDATTAIYSVTPVSGATHYVWNLPSGLTLTDQTGPSVTVAVASSFTSGSISVYAYNDCNATIVKDLTVTKATILPGGVAYNITGNPIICANGSQTYTSTYVDNGVYTWTVPSGITITSGEGTNVITVSAGANFVSGRIQSTCVVSGVTFNASYTVAGVAQPSTIAGPVNLCPINSATYSVTDVPGVTYVWQVPSGMSITSGSGTASINVAINSTSINGDISVRAQTECGLSSPTYLKVSSTPIVGRIFGATRVCGAVETILDANGNIVGNNPLNEYTYNIREIAGATSYTWTVPSGATIVSGQGTNSIVVSYNLSTFGSGNITVRGVNSCGSGIIRSITVSAVTGSISGPTDLCSLNSATYSVPADLGTGFVWTLPDGMSITSGAGTSSINVVLTHPIDFSNINTVSVQFDTACGATKTLTLAVKCNDYTTIRSCGQVINFTDRVYPYDVQGATGYAFDIYEADGTTFITTIENSYSFFRFTQINFTLGATYQVRVRVKRGSVYSVAGTACSVTISNSIPTTTIEASQCGATINYLDRVYPIGVSSATGYAFDIYAADGSTFIRTIENSYSFFRFTQMDFVFGNTYQVRVRVKQGSNYGLAGAACSITIDGALPTTTLETAQCGALINYTDRVYPIGVLGATGYAFDIYGSDGVTFIVTVENTYSFFRFTQINYVLGEKYYVKVRVKRGDQYGDQGAACLVQLNDPNARMVIDEIEEPVTLFTKTDLKAYPNPFTSTFQITPIEGETATMFYQVYDVTGKMIESRSVEANEIAQHVIGDYYPAGMYIVIVNQGAIKQTFKMVKH
jgi:hypothetical protein